MHPTKVSPIIEAPPKPSSVYILKRGKTGHDKPKVTKIDIPLDIVISLLRPDELAKLRKYVASYLGHIDRRDYNTGKMETVS